jgi:hypothetical protein
MIITLVNLTKSSGVDGKTLAGEATTLALEGGPITSALGGLEFTLALIDSFFDIIKISQKNEGL